ncbi:MAG: hypothetical protein B7Z66_08695 [Chromatiales bacterium 21-64-14]|nr:MAG: hypothetical protein B7Z66_08695 [Chromatiales bacterium 21-64-14]HQU16142.1 VacJ family lipoprotein [Gammaproteobacteria bacterium]
MKTGMRLVHMALIPLVLSTVPGCSNLSNFHDRFQDPYEHVNRKIYWFNDTLDRHVLEPVARGYVYITPQPVRTGVSNFFGNLVYLNVIVNDVFQGKWSQGASDSGRFITNSTIGIGGLFDVATHLGMQAHEEDFGQTLAGWGVETDNYLVLPLFGSSSTRDIYGLGVGLLTDPLTYVPIVISIPLGVLQTIDKRAQLLAAGQVLGVGALDPYTFVRQAYHQHRMYVIYDGNPPRPKFDLNSGDEPDSGTAPGGATHPTAPPTAH